MKLSVLVVFALASEICAARIAEPACSQFELFEKLLEKSVRYDHKLELHDGKLNLWEMRIGDKLKEFETAEAEISKQVGDSLEASSAELKEIKRKLENTISETQQKVTLWEEHVEEKTNEMTETMTEINKQVRDSLKASNTESKELFKRELEKTISETQKQVTLWQKQVEEKNNEITKTMAESLKKHELSLQKIQEAYQTQVVVFSAKCTASNDVTIGKVIIFTTMITDVGGGYNKNPGYLLLLMTEHIYFTQTFAPVKANGFM